jgi:hypothetical protein
MQWEREFLQVLQTQHDMRQEKLLITDKTEQAQAVENKG